MAEQPSAPGMLTEEEASPGTLYFEPMLVPPSRVREVNEAAQPLYEQLVITYINKVLAIYTSPQNTVPENIANAQAYVTDERRKDGLDLIMRDAEYYLKARSMIAARKSKPKRIVCMIGGVLLTILYNGLKFVAEPFGGIRADRDNPNSPPGGLDWVTKGASDGYRDQADAMGAATFAQP